MNKRVLLLVNVGTPNKPEKKDVKRYLTQFLNDARVIDLPWLIRKILVNLIIIPFRAGKSTALYKRLWNSEGSPLLVNLNKLVEKIQIRLEDKYRVIGAMRYGNPSLINVLKKIEKDNIDHITVLPLFPQYASSTTGSVIENFFKITGKWNNIPAIRIVGQFYYHSSFIGSFVKRIAVFKPDTFDHIIFSYHGLPLSQIDKVHPMVKSNKCDCDKQMPPHGSNCYRATCFETSRLLMGKLNINSEKTTVAFQSRFSKNWLNPFTDEVIVNLAKGGVKRVLVVSPSFVADCLETIVEVNDYKTLFKKYGGEEMVLVPSLNDDDLWADGIVNILDS